MEQKPHLNPFLALIEKEKNDKRNFPVAITLPGGLQIRGKWWGPKEVRPILCLHGHLDNCGSFDKIIPLLPQEYSYLAIDAPGHGLSDRYPPSMVYSMDDLVIMIERIRRIYGWQKVSIMAHSMGSLSAFFYAAMFPEFVDLYVALDVFEPQGYSPEVSLKNILTTFFKLEEKNQEGEPPASDYEGLLQKLVKGSRDSLDRESAELLMARNVQQSKKDAEKYYLTYDRRLLGMMMPRRVTEDVMCYLKKIVCPLLYMKAKDSWIMPIVIKHTMILNEYMEANFKDYKFVWGPGNHHAHMTHAEYYAEEISVFIRKYRQLQGKL